MKTTKNSGRHARTGIYIFGINIRFGKSVNFEEPGHPLFFIDA